MDKIICVGKNYLKHATELGDPIPADPIFFLKPPSSLFVAQDGCELPLPFSRGLIHHELELVFELGHERGQWTFTRMALGLDLTLRDLQKKLKANGHPWEQSKVFQNSGVIGPFQAINEDLWLNFPFTLNVNGQQRQLGFGRDMRWSPKELLQSLEAWLPLSEGDLLFTGTPEGVGPLQPGDQLRMDGLNTSFTLTCREAN